MPGLLRGIARTAVVAGTATAVSNRVSRRQAGRWAGQEAPAPEQSAPAAPAPAPAPPPPGDDMSSRIDQLKELGVLKEQGILTEAEFAEQKSKILSS
ncbi:SHOCT domain-containing protein [Streptomyces sp. ISL-44]|uniref:SHOCT domain-containing protein n=1 Tax=Streptomyces sp. ISL-44 TaxID=2819184 RepID=UPI001BE8770E|nr:SHOCT domain-containing protein [Streptomyces sp. ISL-44]MBT2545578.1 SHOCT domain-containing protein [Streptomyces sp. ISL-44]